MKNLFLTFFLLFTLPTFKVNAQSSMPYTPLVRDSLSWIFASFEIMTPSVTISEFMILGDTTIGVFPYKKLWHKYHSPSSTSYSLAGLIREDIINKKVYMYGSTGDYIWYDFDLSVGDTVNSYSGLPNTVDSITSNLFLDGNYYTSYWLYGSFRLVEGLGLVGSIPFLEDMVDSYSCYAYKENLIFSDGVICDTTLIKTEQPLAISLFNFSASSTCTHTTLHWSISQDESIAAFIIQGSADGKNWADITTVYNSHSSENIVNYSNEIDRTDQSIKYYRLASLGLHDKIVEYSNIISAQENCNVETSINIYPNPSTGLFNIANTGDAILHIEVKDILGKTVMVTKNTEQLDLKSFADGIYFVSCTTLKGDVFNIKIVKE